MKTEIFILLLSGAVSAALCAVAIPFLKRMNARQYILGYVEEHKSKGGTPTMGGLAFLLAAALCAIPLGLYADKLSAVALLGEEGAEALADKYCAICLKLLGELPYECSYLEEMTRAVRAREK